MKKVILLLVILAIGLAVVVSMGSRYGRQLCKQKGYTCLRIKKGNSWVSLWPNRKQRDIVKRVNRKNTRLRRGQTIAVPKGLSKKTHMQLAPLPRAIQVSANTTIFIDLRKQAFGAYNSKGQLIHWGPVSGGKNYCRDVRRGCRTITGSFRIKSKRGPGCKSAKYPLPRGGAKMPYCMFFFKGFALHGSTLPGYHASHGCVRLFPSDAKWMNRNFVKIGSTKVIIVRR